MNTPKKQLFKKSGFCILGVLLFCFIVSPALSQEKDEMEIVFFNPDSGSQNPVDATNALQTFCNVINKQEGWNLRAYFFKKQKDLEKFLDSRQVELGILSQIFVVENAEKRKLVPFVIPVRNGKTTYRKVVIVSKDKNYRDLYDLKGKTLAATALGDENVPFYNRVVFRGEIDVQKHFKEIQIVDSANSAIMAVLYGQVDAATVTFASFTIMQDLNPQVKNKLVSIFTSAETPISPMVYFKDNLDPAMLPRLEKLLLAMHNDPVGRQSLLAFQVEAWEPTSMDFFKETASILQGTETSAAPVPTKVPTVKTTDVMPEPTEPPVEEKREKPPKITRAQVYKNDAGNALVFNAWVVQDEPGIDPAKTMVTYSIDGSSEMTKTMSFASDDKFTIEVSHKFAAEDAGSQEINYEVKPGDTLGKIATKYLGSSKKYMVIATYNNITNPNVIYVGQKLRIKTGETKVTEVKYYVTAQDKAGKSTKTDMKSQFIF